uniref:Nyctalopin n=1 Tax=Hippocampus comes TaxID=109280 RepID=A0A3Q2Y9C8_HIPCM
LLILRAPVFVFISLLILLPPAALTRWACPRACPQSCSCTQEKSCSVLCDRSGLSELPREFPCEASAINLDKNRLKFLSERAFGTLPSLKSLSLDHNNISFITPGAFKHSSASRNILLHPHLTVNWSLIKFCLGPALKTFFFAQGLSNLVELKMAHNEYISYLHTRTFTGLKKLVYLNLQENRINVIHDQAFQDLVRLENFYLNDNLLSDLPRLAFKGLSRLKMLNLGGNQLTNVSKTWFGDLVELEILYLDRNQLVYIEEGTFENLTSLITLHLNSNNLSTLPFPVFQPIYFLGRLYLFRNPWECDCSLEWLKEWMENYNLVRDIPCSSPSSVAGLDLGEVVFAKVNGTCIDPAELNLTTVSSEVASTTENRFNSLISRLLQQELREEAVNGTDEVLTSIYNFNSDIRSIFFFSANSIFTSFCSNSQGCCSSATSAEA